MNTIDEHFEGQIVAPTDSEDMELFGRYTLELLRDHLPLKTQTLGELVCLCEAIEDEARGLGLCE